MDLMKMNPMARKLTVHTDAFNKALESSDPFAAQNEVAVVAPGESTLMKMNKTGERLNSVQRSDVLPGTIISGRVGRGFTKHTGTFGRYTQ